MTLLSERVVQHRDVIGGGVGSGVAGPQLPGHALAGVGQETHQRVEAEMVANPRSRPASSASRLPLPCPNRWSKWQAYRVLIEGYNGGPLVAGEPLAARPGFWSHHLWGPCCRDAGAVPEWFGDDGADVDAMSEVLMDPERWPVFRVPVEGGYEAVVVYRNLVGDCGVDYLFTHPSWSTARQIASWEGDLVGDSLRWHELFRIVDSPSSIAEGIEDPAARLLLLLPLLTEHALPDEATARLTAALIAVGAPQDTAPITAQHLLEHSAGSPWHDPTWGSPLSGGSGPPSPAGSGVLARLGIT
ncbi:hypothetical protein [Streptomyces sp. NPDC002133]|uniref:hypothetical protein n=1 Tax=Streptomyces sp. NPDC002133 TaxID=3154409 RepID=UPI00332D4C05